DRVIHSFGKNLPFRWREEQSQFGLFVWLFIFVPARIYAPSMVGESPVSRQRTPTVIRSPSKIFSLGKTFSQHGKAPRRRERGFPVRTRAANSRGIVGGVPMFGLH